MVEAYREDGKVKQRTLMSLGRVEDNKLEQLSEVISKHLETVNIFNLSKEIDISDTYILGPLLVLERMVEAMGIKAALQNVLSNIKNFSLILRKLFLPNSVHGLSSQCQNSLFMITGLAACIRK